MSGAPTPAPRLPASGEVHIPVRAAAAEEEPEAPLLKRAPLTFALIASNVAVFVVQVALGGLGSIAFMPAWVLLAVGANNVNATLYENRYETLLTACFVHGSLLHIAFNMVALRQIGPFVERAVGVGRMAPLYVLSGIAASLGSTFYGWQSAVQRVSVGASGAICGLVGAALVIGYRVEGKSSPIMRAMARWLASLFALGLIVSYILKLGGASVSFDNAAHAAGALAGASIAAAWRRDDSYSKSTTIWIVVLCASTVIGAGVRVARYTLTDPFAMLSVDDRVQYATHHIDIGHCAEARIAISSLKHLAPRAPEVALVEQNYRHRCELR